MATLPCISGNGLVRSAGDTWYRKIPTPSAPYDVNATEEEVNFLDQVDALMKYWGHKHAHLERKKATIARKMKREWTDDRNSPKWRHWLRLRTALHFLDRRGETIRATFFQYLFRVVEYCQARSGAKYVAHENLDLSPNSEEGPAGIVSSMLKDISPIKAFIVHHHKGLGRKGARLPLFKGVEAWYTSQACSWCAHRGIKGTLDDRGSSDWVLCDTCRKIYDRHRNACGNIGARAVKQIYGPKKEQGNQEPADKT